jgi:hypothetical protein
MRPGFVCGTTERMAPGPVIRVVRAAIYEASPVAVKRRGKTARFGEEIAFYQNPHLSKRIKVIWGVQSPLRK